MRVMVVDDSSTMRRIITNTVKKLGYTDVVEAEDGEDALRKLYSTSDIEFVITDWNMPVMNGLDFVKKLKDDETLSKLPILMITTRGHKADILEAMRVKVNGYVIKPFEAHTLRDKMDEILAKAKNGMLN